MKKYLSLFVVVALALVVGVSVAGAEDAAKELPKKPATTVRESPSRPSLGALREMKDKRTAFREEMKTKRENFVNKLKTERDAFKTEVKTRKEEFKKLNAERKRDFCGKAKEMVSRKFEIAITELEKFQSRVGEVIAKLKTDGKDTTLAQEALDLSKSKLVDAKAKLAEVKTLVPEGGCENMTPEIFEKIKLGAREAKDLLKESRESLRQAIKEIKGLRNEDKDEDGDEDESESADDNSEGTQ